MKNNDVSVKLALSNSLKELLLNVELDKISVIGVAKKAYVNRNTFYYHFKNIHELAVWTLENDLRSCHRKHPDTPFLTICDIKYMLYENKGIYYNMFNSSAYSVLHDTLMNESASYIEWVIKEKYSNYVLSDEELRLLVFWHSAAPVKLLSDWARSGMRCLKNDYDLVELRERCIETSLEYYAEKRGIKNTEAEERGLRNC